MSLVQTFCSYEHFSKMFEQSSFEQAHSFLNEHKNVRTSSLFAIRSSPDSKEAMLFLKVEEEQENMVGCQRQSSVAGEGKWTLGESHPHVLYEPSHEG